MSKELIKRFLSSLILIPVIFYLIIEGSLYFNIFISICLLISLYEWVNISKKFFHIFFGIFLIVFSFYSIYEIRNYFEGNYSYFLFITITCISTDIGGYIFGKLFKGPKLTKISPNKTYSGMFGSFLLSIITFTFFIENIEIFGLVNEFKDYQMKLNDFIYILIVSLISQLGDLIISYFKRKSKIKNTGNFLPGHGGILDRIDGIIFVVPIIYLALTFI